MLKECSFNFFQLLYLMYYKDGKIYSIYKIISQQIRKYPGVQNDGLSTRSSMIINQLHQIHAYFKTTTTEQSNYCECSFHEISKYLPSELDGSQNDHYNQFYTTNIPRNPRSRQPKQVSKYQP